MDGSLEHLIDPINKLVTQKWTYFITWNHETYLGVARTFESLKWTKVHILKDELVDVDGLQIIGIDYPERWVQKNVPAIIKSLNTFDTNKPSILLFHTPTQVAEIAKTGVNLQLSGHTHVGQIWPFGYITELIFGPYYYGLNTLWDYNIFTSSGLGTWWPPMRVGTKSEIVAIHLK
jgi:predicted MPP superfamily phosphohydrolase